MNVDDEAEEVEQAEEAYSTLEVCSGQSTAKPTTPFAPSTPSALGPAQEGKRPLIAEILEKMEALSANRAELETAELARRFERVKHSASQDDKEGARVDGGGGGAGGGDEAEGGEDERKRKKMREDHPYAMDRDFAYVDFVARPNPGDYQTLRMNVSL